MRRSITSRTAERLIRAAYDFEELANRMKAEGFNDYAAGVRAVSTNLGKLGRSLADKFEANRDLPRARST